jgi:hypothetical protein
MAVKDHFVGRSAGSEVIQRSIARSTHRSQPILSGRATARGTWSFPCALLIACIIIQKNNDKRTQHGCWVPNPVSIVDAEEEMGRRSEPSNQAIGGRRSGAFAPEQPGSVSRRWNRFMRHSHRPLASDSRNEKTPAAQQRRGRGFMALSIRQSWAEQQLRMMI